MKRSLLKMVYTVMVLVIVLPSCTSKLQTSSIGVMVDVTENCNNQNADIITDELFRMGTRSTDDQIGDGMQMYISKIDDQSFGAVKSPPPISKASFWLRNELQRKEEIQVFEKSTSQLIDNALNECMERDRTHVHRNLKQMADELAKSKADSKSLFIFSDMMAHNSLISFYAYRATPENLMNDYEDIASRLQSDMKIDLSDVSIMIIHRPKSSEDELGMQVRRFWRKYLTEHTNAKAVAYKASFGQSISHIN